MSFGIYGNRLGSPITEDIIRYQVFTDNSISSMRESIVITHGIWEAKWYQGPGWTKNTPWPVTNVQWVKSRFDLYEQYKNDMWEYGVYLGMEELFHPVVMASWYPNPPTLSDPDKRYDALATWTIDGEYTRYGITARALKPWYILNKGAWTTTVQNWWDTAKINNNYSDPIILEWSKYYGEQLYKMWHLHMRSLGKKSCIAGYIGIPSDINGADPKYISYIWGNTHTYVMNNYDMIIAYQYPECVSGCVAGTPNPLTLYPNHLFHTNRSISWSVGAANILKSQFKGKLAWILTAHWPDSMGTSNKTVQFEEYKALLQYVDVMMLPIMSEMRNENNINPSPGTDYSPPTLVDFCTTTNTCTSLNTCPELISSLTVSSTNINQGDIIFFTSTAFGGVATGDGYKHEIFVDDISVYNSGIGKASEISSSFIIPNLTIGVHFIVSKITDGCLPIHQVANSQYLQITYGCKLSTCDFTIN